MLQRVGNTQKPTRSKQNYTMPRLLVLRRVPRRYWQILPLEVMKRYQCVVIGAERDALTIAIVNEESRHIFHAITMITGREVFPVLIDATDMYLLLRRIERSLQSTRNKTYDLARPFSVDLYPVNVHTMLLLLTSS